jgi:hypothetical protein
LWYRWLFESHRRDSAAHVADLLGGCELIKKKTAEGLEDKPVPTAPVAPQPVEKK